MGDSNTAFRLAKVIGRLFGVHLSAAQQEAGRDLGRIMGALAVLIAGAIFMAMVLLLLNAAFVVALVEQRQLPWSQAILAAAATNAVLGIVTLLLGRHRLKRPLFAQTRGLVKQTVTALREV